ncbi:uncharacterized protein [Haliotis cracherodii]|uniref:uncharacterized protein isoform X2 n=1 Tax=Haliotis cracherodii TaxID=6455 RepID=UPI0039EBCB8E
MRQTVIGRAGHTDVLVESRWAVETEGYRGFAPPRAMLQYPRDQLDGWRRREGIRWIREPYGGFRRQRVVPGYWGLREEESPPWKSSLLATEPQMQTFELEMEEDQPLDLSMKPRELVESPSHGQVLSGEKHHGQDSPLCLIKDCGCNNHGTRQRSGGGNSVYNGGKYGPPPSNGDRPMFSDSQSEMTLQSRFNDRNNTYESQHMCYDRVVVPKHDLCRQNEVEGAFHYNRATNDEERMDSNAEHVPFEGITPVAQSKFKPVFQTCARTHIDHPSVNYSLSSKYYESREHCAQSFLDLSNFGTTRGNLWKPCGNIEEGCRPIRRPWHGDMNTSSPWGRSCRDWNGRDVAEGPRIHWRPFVDTPTSHGHPSSPTTAHQPSVDTLKSTSTGSVVPQPTTAGSLSGASKSTQPNSGRTAQISTGASCLQTTRTVGHSFASTVPLISKSSVPPRSNSHSSSLSAISRSSGSPILVPRAPYTSIRVTRSPKTFHNESFRTIQDPDLREASLRRSHDGSKRHLSGKLELQEKENIDLTDSGTATSGVATSGGLKMPALDYLISKVLVERIDIPFKPCNTEIKKIYNGESKGRLRLVDLIELQVEESLKA